jgi:NADP-dependent 3-hydroxy acid dehydrogenase YdfG
MVNRFMRDIIHHYGRIDILVANAGVIQVGPMDVMFWGVLYSIWAALPHMTERGSGRIVTITSIGGKVARSSRP